MAKQFSILYFGIYNPEYSRNRVLIRGLKECEVNVIECRQSSKSRFKYLKLLMKYLKTRPKYDVMIVGFPGQEVMLLARFLTFRPIIFDAFTSHYGGYILDRKYYSKNSLRAYYYRFIDKFSCSLADKVLLDTQAHIDFFIREYNLAPEKFKRLFVGSDIDIFYPRESGKKSENFLVHFHGNFIPLQGAEYIIRAAKILEGSGVFFNIIGNGQTYALSRKIAVDLKIENINFIDKVEYSSLADYINQADICLGIFGDSPKTNLVIPNKVFEALAMKKPVITADTDAMREMLVDKESVLLCERANPQSLAEAILKLKNNPELLRQIAAGGYDKFCQLASPKILGRELLSFINI